MLLCHDDYFASPAALRLAREVLASKKDVSAIYCDLLYIDAGRRPIATRRFKRAGRFDVHATARDSILTGAEPDG